MLSSPLVLLHRLLVGRALVLPIPPGRATVLRRLVPL
jgi:hypothetical protein